MNDNENLRVPIGEHVTIYRRGKRAIWTADFWENGDHKRQSLKTKNKKIAIRKALLLEHKLASGTYHPAAPGTTIGAGMQQYIDHLRAEGRASKTIVRYQGELNTLEEFCRQREIRRLVQINPGIVDAYRAERRKIRHAKTVHHETMVLKQLLRWCESRHLIAENPLRNYRVSKPLSQPKPAPRLPEVLQVLTAATPERRVLFATLALTGMRVGELQHLRDIDVDLPTGWVHVVSRPGAETKTKVSRKIPIHPDLLELLRRWRRPKGPFFFSATPSPKCREGGQKISAKRANEDFQRVARRLGMPVGREAGYTLHALRRFFETFCVNSGVPQRAIDVWMGHRSDRSMGAIYYSLSDADSEAMMSRVPFNLDPPASGGDALTQSH
jgi:integrase